MPIVSHIETTRPRNSAAAAHHKLRKDSIDGATLMQKPRPFLRRRNQTLEAAESKNNTRRLIQPPRA